MTSLDRTAEHISDEEICEVSLPVRTIVLPTDGSATAVEATKVAISMASCFGARVVALFIGPGRLEDPIEYASQEQLEGVHHSDAGLAVALRLGEKNGVEVVADRREGAVAHEILQAASAHQAEMIVMGSEGRTGFKRLALGSVAESVVREAHVPVMVVRHGSTPFAMEPRA